MIQSTQHLMRLANRGALLSMLLWASSTAAQKTQDITELPLEHFVQSYAQPLKNLSVAGETLRIGNSFFSKGIGTHSNSQFKIKLQGQATRFQAKVGFTSRSKDLEPDEVSSIPLADGKRTFYLNKGEQKFFLGVEGKNGKIDNDGQVIFKIIGDGKLLYSSNALSSRELITEIDLDISKVDILELLVDQGTDGHSGDAVAWINPQITYTGTAPIAIDVNTVSGSALISTDCLLVVKARQLTACSLPLPPAQYDWLIHRDRAKAQIMQTDAGQEIVISNGLVSRSWRLSPYFATVGYRNLMNNEELLRAVSNEGSLTINGKSYALGGVESQFEYGYFKREWLDKMKPAKDCFQVVDFHASDLKPRIKWAKSRWASNKKDPTGQVLSFVLTHPAKELEGIRVTINFALYDGIPTISKWIEVENKSSKDVVINEFKLEQLALAEPDSPVELGEGDPLFHKPNIHIESDWAFRGMTHRESDQTEHWLPDPRYTSQVNYPLATPCLLEVKLPMGPDAIVKAGETFSTFRVWEMPFDSEDRERKGLFTRQMYRKISPWLTENPIFMHCTSTNEGVVKNAIDQCAETGYEMVILSFGSGLNMEDESAANYQFGKMLSDYAKSKGVELGGYSLLSSRGISADVDVINPKTGKTGGMIFGTSPCLCSEWGYDYFRKIKSYFEKTGMRVFENDGSYPGNSCASTKHAHHRGLADSQWEQRKKIAELYKWMCEQGIYMNIPDFGYMHSGGNKVGIGYREVNWSLPRERQLVIGRQNIYDGMWNRIPSMCWTFVPLTQYHGGGAAATLEPLSQHLKDYEAHMMQNYGSGVQACYRGHRLYDTEQTKQSVKKIISWYKQYRAILNSDIIHIRRPDGRDYDGILHVNPDLENKGMLVLFNPLKEDITRTIRIPLYYTGLTDKAEISEQGAAAKSYQLQRDYSIELQCTIPAESYNWFVIK